MGTIPNISKRNEPVTVASTEVTRDIEYKGDITIRGITFEYLLRLPTGFNISRNNEEPSHEILRNSKLDVSVNEKKIILEPGEQILFTGLGIYMAQALYDDPVEDFKKDISSSEFSGTTIRFLRVEETIDMNLTEEDTRELLKKAYVALGADQSTNIIGEA